MRTISCATARTFVTPPARQGQACTAFERAPTLPPPRPARLAGLGSVSSSGRLPTTEAERRRVAHRQRSPTACRALDQLADLPIDPAVATLSVVVPIAGLFAWKGVLYSQLEYVKASLLGNWVPKGGSVVLQSGTTSRDLYYLPSDTVLSIFVDKDQNKGLLDQAGVQAGVPVKVVDSRPEQLSFQASNSVDAVIGYYTLGKGGRGYLQEVARVLKPGCPFIFIDRVKAPGLQAALQTVLSGKQAMKELHDLEELFEAVDMFDDVTCDIATPSDPHAVGVAMLLGESEDEELQERRISSRRRSRSRKR